VQYPGFSGAYGFGAAESSSLTISLEQHSLRSIVDPSANIAADSKIGDGFNEANIASLKTWGVTGRVLVGLEPN
jgi:hypothetical protein